MTGRAELAARGPRREPLGTEPPAPEARQRPASPRTLREQAQPVVQEQARAAQGAPALTRRCPRKPIPEGQERRQARRGRPVRAAQALPEAPAVGRGPAPLAA